MPICQVETIKQTTRNKHRHAIFKKTHIFQKQKRWKKASYPNPKAKRLPLCVSLRKMFRLKSVCGKIFSRGIVDLSGFSGLKLKNCQPFCR